MITAADIFHGKVLIVDDQPINILLLERMLSAAGYVSLSSTLDSSQVCEMHVENHYDLILLDLQMPAMDGFQVMKSLKEIEPDGYLPVLVITAQPGHKLNALEAGAKDFISKPFELAEVLVRVHNMLEVRLLYKELRMNNDLLELQLHEQSALLAISHTLASTSEIRPDLILEQLNDLIEYKQGVFFTVEDSMLVTLGIRGMQNQAQSAISQIRLNTPEVLDALLNAHQPIRIEDIWSEEPQTQLLRSFLGDSVTVLLDGMHSWMWVPLVVQGRLLGGISLAEIKKNYFTEHHADLMLSVANQSAITMSNAELVGQVKELAIMEERQRLAHDLHDAVNQSLFSAGLIAEALPRLWDIDQQDARRSLEELRLLTRGALAEMRALLAELRPITMTNSNLGDLLHLQADAFFGRTNIPVEIIVTGEFTLPAIVQVAFYRVCQEVFNSIANHANASHVVMALRQDNVGIEMFIHDDGQGFDTEKVIPGHDGLGIIYEHAEEVGAKLSVISQPDNGTALTMSWTTTLSKVFL
ncbi:MAG: response regulator [Geobacteraceae bacterium]|nr:response regulator [Geobacteraceae bacterium]